jgi:transcriptional regulator GlxA family with amidase domain
MIDLQEAPPPWIGAACAFIEANAASQISVRDVASAVEVTSERLLRDFRYYLGFTPADLLDDVLAGVPGHAELEERSATL